MLALNEGNVISARSLVEQAVALFKEMRQQHGTTLSLYALAKVAAAQGDHARSQALCEESLALARQAGDKENIAFSLEGLAAAVAAQERHAWAVQLWSVAEALVT